jgi:transposase
MKRLPNGIYTPEFREQAVRLHEVDGLTMPEVSRRLSLPIGTLKQWVSASRQGKLADVGKNQKPLTELELELARVKRELAEVKMEREILKKATAYFAKESR